MQGRVDIKPISCQPELAAVESVGFAAMRGK